MDIASARSVIEVEATRPRVQWSSLYDWLRTGLIELANLLDSNRMVCVGVICACLVPLAVLESHSIPLGNDEIYTLHIAQQPTLRAMVALSREIDLHPPLHYVAQRIALHSDLPRWMASRLPSLLAALVACLAVFWWTAKRLGNLYGLAAVGMLWLTPVLDYAWDNRPYMLWIAWLCLLLVARDAAVRPMRTRWAVPMVFLLTFAMVMTHMIGVACIGPFLAAEYVRARRVGRADWALISAFTLPALGGLGFFYQASHFAKNSFPTVHLPSVYLAADLYNMVVGNTAWVISGCLMVGIIIFGREPRRLPMAATTNPDLRDSRLSKEELALVSTLLALPLALMLAADVLHVQFWVRYGLASTPAWAVLSVWMIARRLPAARIVAILLVIATTGYMVRRMILESPPRGNAGTIDGGRRPIPLRTLDPSLPIVAASPMTFVEMSDREPLQIAQRVFYLTDYAAALQYSHYTLFESEGKIRQLLNLPSQTEDFEKFFAEHPKFYIVGDYQRPEVWLLHKLAADGTNLDYLGKYESTYESDDLYLVTH
jgi:hypothetical protein